MWEDRGSSTWLSGFFFFCSNRQGRPTCSWWTYKVQKPFFNPGDDWQLSYFPHWPLSNCWCSSDRQVTAKVHFYCGYGWGGGGHLWKTEVKLSFSLPYFILQNVMLLLLLLFCTSQLLFPLSSQSLLLVPLLLLPIYYSSISLQNRSGLPWISTKHGILKSY